VFDFETYLMQAGSIPKPVCMAYWEVSEPGADPQLVTAADAIPLLLGWLSDRSVRLIGHNVRFDLSVFAWAYSDDPELLWELQKLVVDAYNDGRIRCTLIRELLLHIAQGILQDEGGWGNGRETFTLSALTAKYLNIDTSHLKGTDTWRMRYAELDGLPIEEYPVEAYEYPIGDVLYTWGVFCGQYQAAQESYCQGNYDWGIKDEGDQVKAHWDLMLMGLNGLQADPVAVAALARKVTETEAELTDTYMQAGFMRGNGTKDKKAIEAAVSAAYSKLGQAAPLTESGKSVSTSRETLAESGHPVLEKIAGLTTNSTLAKTFLPALLRACEGKAHPKWNCLVASGRVSVSDPNLNNQPRKGGVRECWIPGAGFYFVAADYSMAELCSLAQVCIDLFGYSCMGDAINAGQDLHVLLAGDVLGLNYDEAKLRFDQNDPELIDWRQVAKAGNFGFPGGSSAKTFVAFAKSSYGLRITQEVADKTRRAWLGRWQEMARYFEYISNKGDLFRVEQIRSGRVRGRCYYTSGANTYFQGLTSDGAKAALSLISDECLIGYSPLHSELHPVTREVQAPSPLYGSEPVAFIYDEFLLRSPIPQVHEATDRLCYLMVQGMGRFTPNVKPRVDPAVMSRWFKGAKSKRLLSDGTYTIYTGK
jgi:DNA polymerase I